MQLKHMIKEYLEEKRSPEVPKVPHGGGIKLLIQGCELLVLGR